MIDKYPHKNTASNEYDSVKISDLDDLERKLEVYKKIINGILNYEKYTLKDSWNNWAIFPATKTSIRRFVIESLSEMQEESNDV